MTNQAVRREPVATTVTQLDETARDVFGHRGLLPGQAEAMTALLSGHDVLLVMPTGAGKSLAYQLPAVLLDGPTLVISPLLALQHDQIEGLLRRGGETRAFRISSQETERQRQRALDAVAAGEVEFLFLAPEQLANPDVLDRVSTLRPSLVAVDEAHCVSSWGHDFRPDYLRIGEFVEALGHPRLIALTATAAPPVREDMVTRLRLRAPEVIVRGFARENIHLSVRRCLSAADQRDAVLTAATSTAGQGIVYTGTRKAAEEYAATLGQAGLRTAAYHAGLASRVRAAVHQAFLADELDVIAATSAFGMGIDKPDIRFVLHSAVTDSLDSYYQEVGRAGRDGRPALAALFYRPEDLGLARFFTVGAPDPDDVTAVLAQLSGGTRDRAVLQERTGLGPRQLGRILNLVAEVGVDGNPIAAVVERAEAHREVVTSRIEMMRAYSETMQCRRQFLLGYFGEDLPKICGDCDTCYAGTAAAYEPYATSNDPYPVESRVRHDNFGEGTVMDLTGDTLTVMFTDVGYRTLHLPTVQEQDLLRTL